MKSGNKNRSALKHGSPFLPHLKKWNALVNHNNDIKCQNYNTLGHNYEMKSQNYDVKSHNHNTKRWNYSLLNQNYILNWNWD